MTPYYSDDLVTLYHGDARDLLDVWMEHPSGVMVTDPPYGIGWQQHGGGRNGPKTRGSRRHAGIANDGDTSVRDAILARWADLPAAVFGSWYAPFPERVAQVLVHQKSPDTGVFGATLGWRRDTEPIFLLGQWPKRTAQWSSVLVSRIGLQTLTADHPHAKPIDVLARLIDAEPLAAVVVDPFAGSGSTLVAAKHLGRRAIGIEIEERWCERAASRLSQEVLGLVG
jgi:DNA modification methylase